MKFIKIIIGRAVSALGNRGFFQSMDDATYLRLIFPAFTGYSLDLDKPVTFNEKLQWLKLYDRKRKYNQMVDKYDVRQYLSRFDFQGRLELINVVGGPWTSVDDIDFSKLPNSFVLKCTHDSGSIVICKDKTVFDPETAKRKLKKGLKRNLYYGGREWPYKDLQPRIIAEEYMTDSRGELNDYKLFCFDGEVHFFKIDFDRFTNHGANYYDTNLNLLDICETFCPPNSDKKLNIPSNINDMIRIAEIISKGHPFLRVDLYNVDGKIYFGEATFFPGDGWVRFEPYEWDVKMGEMINLPAKNGV